MTDRALGRPRQTSHDEIRRVALEVFAANGYAATSLAQIAAAVGVSRTTLFSYFPAKRDLLWEDHEAALVRVRAALADGGHETVVDLLVAGMLAASRYDAAEHEMFATRWRITRDDDELRAYTALRSEELLGMLVAAALDAHSSASADLVDSVTRALMAVASRSTEVWSRQAEVRQGLDEFTRERLAPIASALRPLLD